MYKKMLWLAMGSALLIMFSCKQNGKNKFHIVGSFKNATVTKVALLSIPTGKDQLPVTLDSTKLSGSNGTFSLTGAGKTQEIYELIFGDNIPVPIVNDADEIKVDVDLGKKDDYYTVSGSPASNQLKDLISNFGKKNFEVEKNFADLDSLKKINAPDSVMITATAAKNNAIEDLNNYLKKFIETSTNGALSVLALGWSSRSFTTPDFEKELTVVTKKFPDNLVLQDMQKSYYAQKTQPQSPEQAGSWVGKSAPDLSLEDADGKAIPISSFKGKYLLVDFWASWCGPCRMENPNVVKAYSIYKDKNFAILGVSLDKDKGAWQKAIRDDKLVWAQVSDLKYWNSHAVEVFQFQGIPFNVLIDPQGKIIAQELRGSDLENKLKEVLQ